MRRKAFNHLKAWDIDAYLRHLTNKGLKPSSRNTAAATLRSFFRHLVDSGVCTVNPAAFLKRKRNDGKGSLAGAICRIASGVMNWSAFSLAWRK